MSEASRELYNTTVKALPVDELTAVFSNPTNIIASAQALLSLGERSIPTTLRAYAIYRDIWHINYLVYRAHITEQIDYYITKSNNPNDLTPGLPKPLLDQEQYQALLAELDNYHRTDIAKFSELIEVKRKSGVEFKQGQNQDYYKSPYFALAAELKVKSELAETIKEELVDRCKSLADDIDDAKCDDIKPIPTGTTGNQTSPA